MFSIAKKSEKINKNFQIFVRVAHFSSLLVPFAHGLVHFHFAQRVLAVTSLG
jgi:hypothetical protein